MTKKDLQLSKKSKAHKYIRISGLRGKKFNNKILPLILEVIKEKDIVVELGCGPGVISSKLANKASYITCIDNSEEMIRLAKQKQEKENINNISFLHSDMHYTELNNSYADVVILSNSIQCSNSPETLFLEASRIIKPDGIIITITDCYKHIVGIRGLFKSTILFIARTVNLIPWVKFYTIRHLKNLFEDYGLIIIHDQKIQNKGICSLFAILKT